MNIRVTNTESYIFSAIIYIDEDNFTSNDVAKILIERFSLPKTYLQQGHKALPVAIRQVVTDNGKEFLGNFDKTLQEASINHIWTYLYTPKMNATCERFNRTLRE